METPTLARHAITLALLSACLLPTTAKVKERAIKDVESVSVVCRTGDAPSLPTMVYVTYSDSHQEWRQVRWDNAQTSEQQRQATLPSGTVYTVQGYILGDNLTPDGFPLTAEVSVLDTPSNTTLNTPCLSTPQVVAHTLPPADVTLTGENRLTYNRDRDIHELLSLDLSQQLYNYRDTYGLPLDGYTLSDGWDSPTTKLKGHGTGHYMSALAYAFASVDDPLLRDSLRMRISTIVDQLRECQERTFLWSDSLGRYFEARDLAPSAHDMEEMQGTWDAFDRYKQDWQHYGYGYLNAIPPQHPLLIEMYRAYNNEDWVWAPYYTIHKQLAGLIDIATLIDDPTLAAKALLIAKDMGLWVWNRLHYRTFVDTSGTKSQRLATPGNRYEMWNMYIAGEVGGMQESLAKLSLLVSDPQDSQRLREAATFFDAPAFYQPLLHNLDDIRTRHANQHIPMVTGALSLYVAGAGEDYYRIARNFWDLVQGRYAYAMGGVGNGEMFRQPYTQTLSMNTNVELDEQGRLRPNPQLNETCCAYNLAKLTKDLNCLDPDNASLMDYYERVLYNQIVGSLSPTRWAVTYQYAVGLDATKPFGNETPQSSCCGGTGVENHVRYQEATYFANDTTLWVALYLPTRLRWQGLTLSQTCSWPAEESRLDVKEGEGDFAMKLRVPWWATGGFTVRLNGEVVANNPRPSTYVEIPLRHWSKGDYVEVAMPFTPHIFYGPDKMELAATPEAANTPFEPLWTGALMLGPLVMVSPDIHSWEEAEFPLSQQLSEVVSDVPTGDDLTGGPLYTLTLQGKRFVPDYYVTAPSTHYLRLSPTASSTSGAAARKATITATLSALRQAMTSAEERRSDPQAWAPHGFARMEAALAMADSLTSLPSKQVNDKEVSTCLASLKAALATMRPSTLAEPEDLNELLPLLSAAKDIRNKTTPLREAIDYADMVVSYVNDGSGTPDLIAKATERLQQALDDLSH